MTERKSDKRYRLRRKLKFRYEKRNVDKSNSKNKKFLFFLKKFIKSVDKVRGGGKIYLL